MEMNRALYIYLMTCFLATSTLGKIWFFYDSHEDFQYTASGLIISSSNAYASQRFNFSVRSASFCAFVKSLDSDNKVIFTLRNSYNSTIYRIIHEDSQIIQRGENFQRSLNIQDSIKNKFIKICFIRGYGDKDPIFEINPSNVDGTRHGLPTKHQDEFEDERYAEMEFIIGDPSSKDLSFKGTVAGLFITRELTNDFMKYATFDCLKEDPSKQNHKFEDLTTWNRFLSSINVVSFFEMCESHYEVLVTDYPGDITENKHSICKKFNGRALTPYEVVRYNEFLLPIVEAQCKPPGGESVTLVWHDKCKLFDVANINNRISSCMPQHACFVCFYQPSSHYTFFVKPDRKTHESHSIISLLPFKLLKKGASKLNPDNVMWKNDVNDLIYYAQQKWNLQFGETPDIWYFTGQGTSSTLPIGINIWRPSSRKIDSQILTFSAHFNKSHLPCNNGEESYAAKNYCDGSVDCEDESDEVCPTFYELYADSNKKREGFGNRKQWSTKPVIGFSTLLTTFDELESYQRIRLKFRISLNWIDMRTYYWKTINMKEISCNDLIWSPKLHISSNTNFLDGLASPLTEQSSNCHVSLITETYLTSGLPDGVYFGENAIIHKDIQEELNSPCLLHYKYYPFASQDCIFYFWIMNIDSADYDLVSTPTKEQKNADTNNYFKDFFVSHTAHETGKHQKIKVTITFNGFCSYYIGTFYIPSIMIIIMSYSTLFFRRHMINMRIIVSLTAFLAIIFLFSKVNENIMKTSYLKMLDVWFIALVLFSFAILCFNCVFHYFINTKRAATQLEKNERDSGRTNVVTFEIETEERKKNINFIMISKIVFLIVFLIFLLSYIITAVVV